MNRILAVSEDEEFLMALTNRLQDPLFQVETLADPLAAETACRKKSYDCVFIDLEMTARERLALVQKLLTLQPGVPVIVTATRNTLPAAMEAINIGAFDFVEKPVPAERLRISLQHAVEWKHWQEEKRNLLVQLEETYLMIGVSDGMRQVFEAIQRVAPSRARVLVLGESGTGKELVARAIHHQSPRNGKPFVKVNCAAIPAEVLERKLFGFPGNGLMAAAGNSSGKVLAANGGTLFLDEIADLDFRLQAQLLRVLEREAVESPGDHLPHPVDVRIIAATNKNLERRVAAGRFREDLYHRLNVVQIYVPPLRERVEDIIPLANYFLQHFAEMFNKPLTGFTPGALRLLTEHEWPGNVRQLKRVIEYAAFFAQDGLIREEDVQMAFYSRNGPLIESDDPVSLKAARDAFERQFILTRLQRTGWKIQETARLLKIDRSALFKKMRKLGIVRQSHSGPK
ncbi:MAG: sigma-54-dependent Fis family transcriptional regulator [Calditrichaeota bacterium]|nr:sigma-54-dependent Fis family transcriptional regulator [Calditrichota bacterium]